MTRKRGLVHRLALLVLPLLVLLVGTTTAQADTANDKAPIAGPFANPCNLEPFTFSGDLHTLVHVTGDSSGGFHSEFDQNFQGVSGIGASGTTYSMPFTLHDNFNFQSGAYEETRTEHLGVISHGSAPNFELIETFRLIVDASGNVTYVHYHFAAVCID